MEDKKKVGASRDRCRSCIAKIVGFLSVSVVAYLALRASPWVTELPWIPQWVGAWADRNGNLRSMPAFAVLALFLIWPLGLCRGTMIATVLAVSLEAAQIFIAGRSFDWADIGWSLAGVVAVAVAACAFNQWRRQKLPCN